MFVACCTRTALSVVERVVASTSGLARFDFDGVAGTMSFTRFAGVACKKMQLLQH